MIRLVANQRTQGRDMKINENILPLYHEMSPIYFLQSCEGGESADSVVDHSMEGWPAPIMDRVCSVF